MDNQKSDRNHPKEEQKDANPNKDGTDLNLEEMGADQYDYGVGRYSCENGPGIPAESGPMIPEEYGPLIPVQTGPKS